MAGNSVYRWQDMDDLQMTVEVEEGEVEVMAEVVAGMEIEAETEMEEEVDMEVVTVVVAVGTGIVGGDLTGKLNKQFFCSYMYQDKNRKSVIAVNLL